MAKQLITIGTPGAGGGDPAHAAFKKINDNTNEVYSFLGADGLGNLTPEGAREALEVYSRDEVDDLVENADFASLGTNTFTGKQTIQAGLDVTGDFEVNGINIMAALAGDHAVNGRKLLPNPSNPSKPLILRWGEGSLTVPSNSVASYSHSFPAAFPNNCYFVMTQNINQLGAVITTEEWSRSQFSGFARYGSETKDIRYRYYAIGD